METNISLTLEGNINLNLDLIWLRDHCKCELCYDHVNSNRKLNILDIPDDISTKRYNVDNEKLNVVWSDEHKSEYELSFLIKFQPLKFREKTKICLWNKESFVAPLKTECRFAFGDYINNPDVQKGALKSLHDFGVAFIDGAEPSQDATESVVTKLFPVHKTFFGEMWTFSEAQKDLNISAYTSKYLGPHNDNAYFSDAAGLQVLHCLHHLGSGGENFLIDGFQIADKIKRDNPEVFERLTKTLVGVEYKEDGHHFKYEAPIISVHPVTGEIVQVRYNMDDRVPFNTLPAEKIREFYKDFKILTRELQDESNQITFKLRPGTVMIFDNWRLLHGRHGYSGSRTMTGCYISRDEYQSTLRINDFIE